MMMKKGERSFPSTLVIIATLNEEDGIGPTLAEVKSSLNESSCLVVDGRSIDSTVEIAEAMGAHVIFQKGLGKGDAISAAVEHASALDVKYIVFVDADFTYPAEYLPEMIRILEDNPDLGMVCGNRFNGHIHFGAMPNMFYVGNRLLAFIHNLLNGVHLSDPLTGLRVVRSEIVRGWRPKSKGFDIEVELNHRVENIGFRIMEMPIHYRRRLGKKKLRFGHGLTILMRIIKECLQSPNQP
jgi:glycosyltransferase involved in cell wall biosynthesis